MEEKLLEQLNIWHETDEYQKIIDTIEDMEEHDYETICHLARAYNNRGEAGDYDRAIQLLQMVSDIGQEDPLWHYRAGVCLVISIIVLMKLLLPLRVLELDPDDDVPQYLLNFSKEGSLPERGRKQRI